MKIKNVKAAIDAKIILCIFGLLITICLLIIVNLPQNRTEKTTKQTNVSLHKDH